MAGGEGGIRTLDSTIHGITAFETAAFDLSATSPTISSNNNGFWLFSKHKQLFIRLLVYSIFKKTLLNSIKKVQKQ